MSRGHSHDPSCASPPMVMPQDEACWKEEEQRRVRQGFQRARERNTGSTVRF